MMILWVTAAVMLLHEFGFGDSGVETTYSDMNEENARVLKREQSGGTVAPMRTWSCDNVQLEMARYGHPVIDCLMHNGNVWFRIDTAMTWRESWQACHAIAGGNLASVHSADDYGKIRALHYFDQWQNAGNWLGLNRILNEPNLDEYGDQYQWSDGSKFEYRKWSPIQATDTMEGNCVYFGNMIGSVSSILNNGSVVRRQYTIMDGFATEECGRTKLPICKVTNVISSQNRS